MAPSWGNVAPVAAGGASGMVIASPKRTVPPFARGKAAGAGGGSGWLGPERRLRRPQAFGGGLGRERADLRILRAVDRVEGEGIDAGRVAGTQRRIVLAFRRGNVFPLDQPVELLAQRVLMADAAGETVVATANLRRQTVDRARQGCARWRRARRRWRRASARPRPDRSPPAPTRPPCPRRPARK